MLMWKRGESRHHANLTGLRIAEDVLCFQITMDHVIVMEDFESLSDFRQRVLAELILSGALLLERRDLMCEWNKVL